MVKRTEDNQHDQIVREKKQVLLGFRDKKLGYACVNSQSGSF